MVKRMAIALATVLAFGPVAALAQVSDGVIKIGVLNDQSSLYADLAGQGSVVAARMAVEDFGADKKGLKVLQHLRDHTDIPLTLMTAALDKGDFFKVAENYKREFQLVTVLNKDNRTDAEAPDLEATVARMVRSRPLGRR